MLTPPGDPQAMSLSNFISDVSFKLHKRCLFQTSYIQTPLPPSGEGRLGCLARAALQPSAPGAQSLLSPSPSPAHPAERLHAGGRRSCCEGECCARLPAGSGAAAASTDGGWSGGRGQSERPGCTPGDGSPMIEGVCGCIGRQALIAELQAALADKERELVTLRRELGALKAPAPPAPHTMLPPVDAAGTRSNIN